MTKVRKTYTPEFKLEMIKLIEEQGQKLERLPTNMKLANSLSPKVCNCL